MDNNKKVKGKLVRDLYPEIAERNGRPGDFRTMGDAEYRQSLYDKLLEEGEEVGKAHLLPLNEPLARRAQITAELADLVDVVDAIMTHEAITEEELAAARELKLKEKGGFTMRIKLVDST